jgi:hypothetical protein
MSLDQRHKFMVKTWSSDISLPDTLKTREEAIEYVKTNNWFDKRGGITLFEVTPFYSEQYERKTATTR